MASVVSPTNGALFLGTLSAQSRSYLLRLFCAARERGYSRFVEPACGALAMSHLALQAGFHPTRIEASDVSLFSAVMGYAVTGQPLDALGIKLRNVSDELMELDTTDPAVVLWLISYLRLLNKAQNPVVDAARKAAWLAREEQTEQLRKQLARAGEALGGMTYTAEDLFDHLGRVWDDPQAIVCVNPPTYCLAPDERILTADLRWVPCGDLRVGDKILAFDEETPAEGYRRWLFGEVTYSEPAEGECVRVHLEDGTSVVCTADHPWLADKHPNHTARRGWVRADELEGKFALRALDTWEPNLSYEAGWLAGVLDDKVRGLSVKEKVGVIRVEPLGTHPIQTISTSCRTYVGEGFLMHNTGGFERYYDTGGRLTWREPSYDLFDADAGLEALMARAMEAKALVICYQEREAGQALGHPIYIEDGIRRAKGLAHQTHMFLCANRGGEALEMAGGFGLKRRIVGRMEPGDFTVLPPDYEPPEQARLEFMEIPIQQALYYRSIWTHTFAVDGGGNIGRGIAMLVDGYLAGVFGYDQSFVVGWKQSDVLGRLMIHYGMAVPNRTYRYNRLLTMVAMHRDTINTALADFYASRVTQVATVQQTRHPESKEMRGLMKLENRKPHPRYGFKLVYVGSVDDEPFNTIWSRWLKRERHWLKARAKDKAVHG